MLRQTLSLLTVWLIGLSLGCRVAGDCGEPLDEEEDPAIEHNQPEQPETPDKGPNPAP